MIKSCQIKYEKKQSIESRYQGMVEVDIGELTTIHEEVALAEMLY